MAGRSGLGVDQVEDTWSQLNTSLAGVAGEVALRPPIA